MARRRSDIKATYRVTSAKEAKTISLDYLKQMELDKVISFGLPEIDDRFNIWRVPLKSKDNVAIGEVVIDAITTLIDSAKSTPKDLLENRLLGRTDVSLKRKKKSGEAPKLSMLRNTVGRVIQKNFLKNFLLNLWT